MNYKEFLNKNGIEVYKLLNQTEKDFIILDLKLKETYTKYTLVKLYELLIDKDPVNLFKIICDEAGLKVINGKNEKALQEYCFEELITNGFDKNKGYFQRFKNLALIHCNRVNGIKFEPINERLLNSKGKYLNTYMPKNDYSMIKPNLKANFELLHILMENISGKQYISRFYSCIAWKIQNPTKPIPIHWVIIDDGGTGKTSFLANDILRNIFNTNIIDQDDLNSQYNEYVKNTTMLVCEEIEDYKNYKKIKLLTGSKKITIKEKYGNLYSITNHNTIIIMSNDIKPLKIDKNDRRFNFVGGGKRIVPLHYQTWEDTLFESSQANKEFFEKYHKELDTQLKNFYSYLLALKLDENEIQQPLDTLFKEELIDLTKSSHEHFIDDIKELGLGSVIENTFRMKADYIKNNYILYQQEEKAFYIINNDLYNIFVEYCKGKGLHKNIIHDNNFFKRINLHKDFNECFENVGQKWINSKRNSYYKIKVYQDENKTIN